MGVGADSTFSPSIFSRSHITGRWEGIPISSSGNSRSTALAFIARFPAPTGMGFGGSRGRGAPPDEYPPEECTGGRPPDAYLPPASAKGISESRSSFQSRGGGETGTGVLCGTGQAAFRPPAPAGGHFSLPEAFGVRMAFPIVFRLTPGDHPR